MPRERKKILGVDPKLLIKDAAKLLPDPSRRLFLRGAVSLGALATLTGCDIIDGPTAESALRVVSRFNDWVQARLFSETTLATEYPESAITRPFPFNAYYAQDEAPEVDGETYQLEIGGLVDNKKPWTLAELYKLPEVSQITRHVCAEGCSNTIDMPTALHPQTQLTLKFDHQILPRAYGFPIKIRIPTKLGFKNPKYVTAMWVQNNDAGGYWENQGYNWFSGQ